MTTVLAVAGPRTRVLGSHTITTRSVNQRMGQDATTTCDALITTVSGMPSALVKTLTWDQGSELAAHAAFSLATEVSMYFARPHSPWERGTNENTNGLPREYFPKGTEITDDQTYLDCVTLNGLK